MALDRQRILTELGSVVNQLQSADCGCMGKLFNDPGQNGYNPMGNPLPTCGGCRRGCCHGHGGNVWNSGRPCSDSYAMNGHQNMQRPCMGHCNPTKLYSDTYNYLTENLMQPTIKEVYNDLSTITPNNTIMNSPMGNQMVSQDAYAAQNASNLPNNYNNMNSMQNNMGDVPTNEIQGKGMGQMEAMGGMGPQIMGMIGSNQVSKPNTMPNQVGNLKEPMLIDAPQSPHGVVGVTPLSAPMRNNEGIYNNNNVVQNVGYQNPNQYNNMAVPNMTNATNNPQNMQGYQNIPNTNANPAAQQMSTPPQHNFGRHAPGIAKFNEMFPGVMKGIGGDLNFDPMAMAIQMNPANQHQSAMDAMQKMMTGNRGGLNNMLNRVPNLTPERPGMGQALHNSNLPQTQPNVPVPQGQNVNPDQNNIPAAENQGSRVPADTNQQVYAAVNQQVPQQQIQNPQQQEYNGQQQIMNPNSGNPAAPPPGTLYEGGDQQNAQAQPADSTAVPEVSNTQQFIKEPIFPADTSKYYVPRRQRYEQTAYNTLGQPVQMLPAQMYHTPEPALPQTLSPQPYTKMNAARYSNVKSTVSKTSLIGAKPLGRSTSRNQLQHIYNQYKGSQSYTQNNGKVPDNGVSYSDGKINVPRTNAPTAQQVPVEKIGGDTIANNQFQDQRTTKVEQVIGQLGDVPATNKPNGDLVEKDPQVIKKTRNGLQDQVFTAYPTSAAWSFHGDGVPRYTAAYRNRYRF
ncbi:uncharacterized protein LOC116771575 isoform X1 [Danaus plexippus]|uniref:uncharacterized protein LOC116771575 isoform X1 n=1 Tax=Danaus plexippus TaxID=13037 RepID=UPI002AB1969B|nr:uncharacterized protein LOC116771575 isoform X1 [Danaus plexippus]